jgi:hypothetical protein
MWKNNKNDKGIKGSLMKKLYEAVAILKVLYAINIWGMELLKKERGKKRQDGDPAASQIKSIRSNV